ncbi:mannose-1-phosphate guanylyltransferase/mannose-6-phosphate isomerase [Pseudofrancisella aestuarii]|uniref:mannose-1-phosphate guanylyltransferase n=1 Tax=Pseudofrancisella aestuarii TaxID=2670347 RepID=A0ABV9TBZ1_9GAMM|nr:mannose-1-phosphate guanylyltransferase/mannose-6-phosphate isomerase [Pseudofrancisella aestuarii]
MQVVPVILAGGSGSRLWPLSRKMYPKQFLPVVGEKTMLQDTVVRASKLTKDGAIVVCSEEHRYLASEELLSSGIKDAEFILEAFQKNTAASIALAAQHIINVREDAVMVVLPADHYMCDENYFYEIMSKAIELAKQDHIVLLGIEPTSPETGYGYIKKSDKEISQGAYVIDSFKEKPSKEIAKTFLESSDYFWNSGMFILKASVYLSELHKYRYDIYGACEQAMLSSSKDSCFIRPNGEIFSECPEESVDFAVMEKTKKALILPFSSYWSDVGSWSSLWAVKKKDQNDNAITGNAFCLDTKNTLVDSREKLTVTLGLDNLIIVDTKDALLVAHKSRDQDVKNIVNELKKDSTHVLTELHRDVHRPWGKYDSIDKGDRYQVKRITVKPKAKLSVQMHHHRSEHWIIVSGTARVSVDGKESLLTENQSIYIPVGSIHYLENPGNIPLELIEVQSGSYLGEDDIVRFNDIYGRA